MTDGERAALREATATGWINPPVYNCLRPEGIRPWRTVHLRYLERRRMVRRFRYRIDGVCCIQLNDAGWAARADALDRIAA
ncbi:hypothetical protein [Sphingomonas hankookensis]|uniref:hypothetical protein n=1 Tax=Sphingomonas hankookensis TaxID=563996 RepID=UPI003D301B47